MVTQEQAPFPASASATMARLAAGTGALEPFTRLDRSRLWSINAEYWRTAGHHAFLRDSVPYYATSDGTLSDVCTRFLAGWAGTRTTQRVTVIELGPGSGLFARGVMRGWRRAQETDAALPPLRYVVVDVSQPMMQAMVAHGVLAVDGVDTACVEIDLNRDPAALGALIRQEGAAEGSVLVVANYLLDSLPTRHFRTAGGVLLELEVSINRQDDGDAADARGLVVRHRYTEADLSDPMAALARDCLEGDAAELTLNTQALACIGQAITALGDDGLLLFSDYAGGSGAGGGDAWQAFGGSVAAGLDFPSIDRFVTGHGAQCIAAHGQPHLVTSRLVGKPDASTADRFRTLYALEDAVYAQGRIGAARAAHRAGQLQVALASYDAALAAQPDSWGLLLEVAGFAITALKRADEGRALLAQVLAANPISTVAMNLMGDCDYGEGAFDAAIAWYQRAEAIAGGDARARLNLAYCAARQDRLEDALHWIAGALAADPAKDLTAEILERQAEIIQRIGPGL